MIRTIIEKLIIVVREFITMMHNYNTEMADPEAEDLQRTREIMEAFRLFHIKNKSTKKISQTSRNLF